MKEKLAHVKQQIKNHVPEILVVTTAVAGVAGIIYLLKNQEPNDRLLALTNDEWDTLSSGGAISVLTDNGMLYITKEYHLG